MHEDEHPTSPTAEPSAAAPVVAWAAPVEATGPAPGVEYAPHGARFVAYLLDGLVLLLVDLVLMIPLFIAAAGFARDRAATLSGPEIALSALLLLGLLVVNLLYFPAFWASGGQTPGMRPFRLRVVRDRDGSRFGWGTALLRLVGLYVASAVFYLGFIWIFIDKRHRGWHDLIAGTIVVRHVGDPGT
jgi:uncharacterized RDD family membrane protein YckC